MPPGMVCLLVSARLRILMDSTEGCVCDSNFQPKNKKKRHVILPTHRDPYHGSFPSKTLSPYRIIIIIKQVLLTLCIKPPPNLHIQCMERKLVSL